MRATAGVPIGADTDAVIRSLSVDLATLRKEVEALRAEVADLRQAKKTGSDLFADQPDTLLNPDCQSSRSWRLALGRLARWRRHCLSPAWLAYPDSLRNARKFGDAPVSYRIGGGNNRITYRLADLARLIDRHREG